MADRAILKLPNFPLVVAITTWAVNFVVMKSLYVEMPPSVVALLRFLIMFAVVVPICLLQREPLTIPSGAYWRTQVQGFLSMGLYMVLFLEGLARTGGAECSILLNTSPIWTALFAIVAKQEKFHPGVIVGAVVAFAGVATVVLGSPAVKTPGAEGAQHLLGIAMVLGSAVIWALSTVISKPLLGLMAPIRMMAVSLPVAALILVPYGYQATMSIDWPTITPAAWLILGHVTLLAGVAGFLGFYAGVKQIGAGNAMMYQYFVPPMAALLEWQVYGRSLTWIQLAGFLVVVAGVLFANRARSGRMESIEP